MLRTQSPIALLWEINLGLTRLLYSSLLAQERGLGVIRSEGKKPIIASEEQHESLLSCCPSDAKYIFDIISSSLLTPPTLPYTRGGMKRVSPKLFNSRIVVSKSY